MDHDLQGFIQVAEAPPHPNSHEMATQINVDTITNATIRKKLGLSPTREGYFEIPPTEVLERYFGGHSASAKAYKTQLALDCLPRQKVGVIITTFEGKPADWGVFMGVAL